MASFRSLSVATTLYDWWDRLSDGSRNTSTSNTHANLFWTEPSSIISENTNRHPVSNYWVNASVRGLSRWHIVLSIYTRKARICHVVSSAAIIHRNKRLSPFDPYLGLESYPHLFEQVWTTRFAASTWLYLWRLLDCNALSGCSQPFNRTF